MKRVLKSIRDGEAAKVFIYDVDETAPKVSVDGHAYKFASNLVGSVAIRAMRDGRVAIKLNGVEAMYENA